MATKTVFCCQSCGSTSPRWTGKCAVCGEWDSIVEETLPSSKKTSGVQSDSSPVLSLCGEEMDVEDRFSTGIDEFDRVFGGGIVSGSSVLVGGEPGIGKSTLMLQISSQLTKESYCCLYVSGEESANQIRARANRLKILNSNIKLMETSSLSSVENAVRGGEFKFLVIDSVQTIHDEEISSSPGTVVQVRMCAHKLILLAKKLNIALFLLGQITKEGIIAGPKTLEHMVDTVLYFEGSNGSELRILRTVKNRFGPTNEMGVFEMSSKGLVSICDPSLLFLSQSVQKNMTGSVVFAGMEGSRPILVEVQSLISSTYMASPRRAVVGWEINRLAMIIAVLNARCDVYLADQEVYLNIAGGLRICEPASDLAIAMSLISSAKKAPSPSSTVVFGEVALSGEIRGVSNTTLRIREACKLGFKHAIVPAGSLVGSDLDIDITEVTHIKELKKLFT